MLKVLYKNKLCIHTLLLLLMTCFSSNQIFSSEDGQEQPAKRSKIVMDEEVSNDASATHDAAAIFDWRDINEIIKVDTRPWDERAEEMAQSWGLTMEKYLKKADEYINFRIKKELKTSGRTRQGAREGLFLLPRPNIEKVNEQF